MEKSTQVDEGNDLALSTYVGWELMKTKVSEFDASVLGGLITE